MSIYSHMAVALRSCQGDIDVSTSMSDKYKDQAGTVWLLDAADGMRQEQTLQRLQFFLRLD